MPIIDIQRSIQEVGRIRTGEQVGTGRTKHPSKLEKFRLTSRDHVILDECAALYGGEVREWEDSPGSGAQWELYTEASTIDVIVPPGDLSFTQWYELWNAGGCVRRCDGAEQDYTTGGGPCQCDPDREKRECKMTTRLSLFMANLNRLGLWRLESHGYYAAVELKGNVDLLAQAAALGHMLPAALRLEQRTRKFLDKNGKSMTRNYVVPTLDVRISAMALLGLGSGAAPMTALEAGMPSALQPVPPIDAPAPTVAEAVAEVDHPPERTRTARSAEPIAPTGRRRRRAANTDETEQQALDLGDGPPPDEPPVDLEEQRKQLAARLSQLPTVIAAQVKNEWPTLNFPTTLRRATGWNESNIALCVRFVDAAEKKASDMTKEARKRAGIKFRELGMDDDARHAFVQESVGKPGLTECTLDELADLETKLAELI